MSAQRVEATRKGNTWNVEATLGGTVLRVWKPPYHHHRREGKLSQWIVEEAENYREENEPNKSNIVTKSGM